VRAYLLFVAILSLNEWRLPELWRSCWLLAWLDSCWSGTGHLGDAGSSEEEMRGPRRPVLCCWAVAAVIGQVEKTKGAAVPLGLPMSCMVIRSG